MSATDLQLTIFDRVPDGFLDCRPTELAKVLPGPSLIDLPGRHPQPLFVSVLLHGNEDSGVAAVQEALRRHGARELQRRLILFVGNIAAAALNVRTLPGQTDYNRVWPGTLTPHVPEARLARQVFDYAAARRPFASLDIHNNTGFNPHYSCIRRLEQPFLSLARLFGQTIVHFRRPLGVQIGAFSTICPAVTVECGKTGSVSSTTHAVELIEACLSIAHLPSHPVSPHDVDLLRTYAIVKIPSHASFSFDDTPADFRFRSDIDQLNFSELPAGTSFGRVGSSATRLEVVPGAELDKVEAYFDYRDGNIRLTQGVIPAMLTRDAAAIRQDCLCYLMHRIGLDGEPRPPGKARHVEV
ncbi:MAG: succinylglutamate desuccinylase/aspartoacylase family protein [Methylocystis sp.]|nr:succinylglutamate desuccinylase/aspartoacylase family protein [Methylocystis sp.]